MDHKTYKVAISIPTEGNTQSEAYINHLLHAFRLGRNEELWRHKKRAINYEFYWFSTGRMLTSYAREQLIVNALSGDMDFIIMYDDDMIIPPDMAEAMLQDMEEHPEMDVLAALAFMRNAPHFPVIYSIQEGYDAARHKPYYRSETVKKYPKDTIVECEAVGFGAVCIRMEKVRKMKPPYCFTSTATGEDIYFCVNARQQVGARIFVDTRIKLGHLGKPPIIDEDHYEKHIKEHGIEVPDDEQIHPYLKHDR